MHSYSAEGLKQSNLPDLNGSLSASVSPTAINEVVTRERASVEGVSLSSNLSSSCNQQVCPPLHVIHGNQAAIRHFSKQLGVIFSSARRIIANLQHALERVQ